MPHEAPGIDRAKAKARANALLRHRGPNDPDYLTARRDLAAATLAARIRAIVDAAPPLSPEQRDKLSALLRGGAA